MSFSAAVTLRDKKISGARWIMEFLENRHYEKTAKPPSFYVIIVLEVLYLSLRVMKILRCCKIADYTFYAIMSIHLTLLPQ